MRTTKQQQFSQTTILALAVLGSLIISAVTAGALLYLQFKFLVIMFIGLMGIWLCMITRDRRLVLGLLVFVIPLNIDINIVHQPSPGGADGITLGLFDILLFQLAGLTCIRSVLSKRPKTLRFFPALLLPSVAMLFFYLVSMLNAHDVLWSLFDTIAFVKVILFYLILANNVHNTTDVQIILIALFLGMIVQAGIATAVNIFPAATEVFLRAKIGVAAETHVGPATGTLIRSGGSLGNANHLGRYFALLLPLSYMIIFVRQSRTLNVIALVAALCGTFAIINTLSRSAWLGLVISLLIIAPLLLQCRLICYRTLAKLGLSIIIGILFLIPFGDTICTRLTDDDHGSAKTRLTTAKVAWSIIQDYPFFGCGINNYGAMLADYWIGEDTFTNKAAVHNNYLLYMAEIGIVGFAAVFWWLAAFGARVVAAGKSQSPFLKAIAIGICGSYAGMLIESLSDKSYKENFPLLVLVWAFMALVEAIIRLNGEQRHDHRAIALKKYARAYYN